MKVLIPTCRTLWKRPTRYVIFMLTYSSLRKFKFFLENSTNL